MSRKTTFVVLYAHDVAASPAGSLLISLLKKLPDRLPGFFLLTSTGALPSDFAFVERSLASLASSVIVDLSGLIVELGRLCEVSAGSCSQDCLSKIEKLSPIQRVTRHTSVLP